MMIAKKLKNNTHWNATLQNINEPRLKAIMSVESVSARSYNAFLEGLQNPKYAIHKIKCHCTTFGHMLPNPTEQDMRYFMNNYKEIEHAVSHYHKYNDDVHTAFYELQNMVDDYQQL